MMTVTLLVTNGGPHPPDKWAALASSKIADLIQIDDRSDSDAAAEARKAKPRFALDVSDAVELYFASVTSGEQARVESGETASRGARFTVDGHLDDAVSSVVKASSGTPFKEHFSNPDVQKAVRSILNQYFLDAANIQRSWAFDAKGL